MAGLASVIGPMFILPTPGREAGGVEGGADREVVLTGEPSGCPLPSWRDGQAEALWAHPRPAVDRLVVSWRQRAGVTAVLPVAPFGPPAATVVGPTGGGPCVVIDWLAGFAAPEPAGAGAGGGVPPEPLTGRPTASGKQSRKPARRLPPKEEGSPSFLASPTAGCRFGNPQCWAQRTSPPVFPIILT